MFLNQKGVTADANIQQALSESNITVEVKDGTQLDVYR